MWVTTGLALSVDAVSWDKVCDKGEAHNTPPPGVNSALELRKFRPGFVRASCMIRRSARNRKE